MSITLRWLVIVERALLGVFAAACFYVLYFFLTVHDESQWHAFEWPVAKRHSESKISLPSLPLYEVYAKKVEKRDLFSFSITSSGLAQLGGTGAAGVLPNYLKVVGIVLGKPTEVILEDTASHQTLFIQQGQKRNGISIDKVETNRVILNYQGQAVVVPLKENR